MDSKCFYIQMHIHVCVCVRVCAHVCVCVDENEDLTCKEKMIRYSFILF